MTHAHAQPHTHTEQKLSDAGDLTINTLELWLVAQKLLKYITESERRMPRELRQIITRLHEEVCCASHARVSGVCGVRVRRACAACAVCVCGELIRTCAHARAQVGSKFNEMATYRAMGGFYFLRLICPALMAPQAFGLLDEPPHQVPLPAPSAPYALPWQLTRQCVCVWVCVCGGACAVCGMYGMYAGGTASVDFGVEGAAEPGQRHAAWREGGVHGEAQQLHHHQPTRPRALLRRDRGAARQGQARPSHRTPHDTTHDTRHTHSPT
jgi:hypothetical protein